MRAILAALAFAGSAFAQPMGPPSLGGPNDFFGALGAGTIVGGLAYLLFAAIGERLKRHNFYRAGRALKIVGALAWIAAYVVAFSL